MSEALQNVLALIVVLGCVVYLLQRMRKGTGSNSRCDGCAGCTAANKPTPPGLRGT